MPTAAGVHYFLHTGGSKLKVPLVLIHGAGGDHLSWPAEARRLPETNVYTLDLPGHGKSSGAGCQTVEDYARSVITFMDAASLFKAVFGGHGMGGAICLELALAFPERVAGLMLISTGARLPLPNGLLENGSNPSTLQSAIHTLEEAAFAEKSPQGLREAYSHQLLKLRQTLLLGDWRACDYYNVESRLEEIHRPALVLWGKEDRLTPRLFSENLASRIPGAALQVVEDAGHMLVLEQPKRLAKLMEIFLKTILYWPGG